MASLEIWYLCIYSIQLILIIRPSGFFVHFVDVDYLCTLLKNWNFTIPDLE